jgi:hypothetical protein
MALMKSSFDHCFFTIAYKTKLWKTEDLEKSGVSFFNNTTGKKLKGTCYQTLLPFLGFREDDEREEWVHLLRCVRNCFVHRTGVWLQKDVDNIEVYLNKPLPPNINKTTFIVSTFLHDVAGKLFKLTTAVEAFSI